MLDFLKCQGIQNWGECIWNSANAEESNVQWEELDFDNVSAQPIQPIKPIWSRPHPIISINKPNIVPIVSKSDIQINPLIPDEMPNNLPLLGTQDENGNMHYDVEAFAKATNEERFGINEVPANCAEIQVDYKDGEANCVIFIDKDGNRIGHMYTKDQVGDDGTVADDAKANKVILYDNADQNARVLNIPSNEQIPVGMNVTYATLGQFLSAEGFDFRGIGAILHKLGKDSLNYAIDTDENGVSCIKITDENGIRIGHMYINGDNEDNNKLILYGNEENGNVTTVFEFDDNKCLSKIFENENQVYSRTRTFTA